MTTSYIAAVEFMIFFSGDENVSRALTGQSHSLDRSATLAVVAGTPIVAALAADKSSLFVGRRPSITFSLLGCVVRIANPQRQYWAAFFYCTHIVRVPPQRWRETSQTHASELDKAQQTRIYHIDLELPVRTAKHTELSGDGRGHSCALLSLKPRHSRHSISHSRVLKLRRDLVL